MGVPGRGGPVRVHQKRLVLNTSRKHFYLVHKNVFWFGKLLALRLRNFVLE